jgi:hypothetical protein
VERRLHMGKRHSLKPFCGVLKIWLLTQEIWDMRSMGKVRNKYKILAEKRTGRRPVGRSKRRWGITLKRILKKMGREGVYWVIRLMVGSKGGLFRIR